MLREVFAIDPRKARVHRLRSSIREACTLHEQEADYAARQLGRQAYRKTFITLTYRDGGDWQRRHISDFLKNLRQWLAVRDSRLMYAWVAELQQRGALHYHVIVWVPRRLRLPQPDRSGWWPHGMSNIETARNPVGYMVKYATKTRPEDLKRLKKGVRLHGNGGHTPERRVALREALAPWWLRKAWEAREVAAQIAHYEAQDERQRNPGGVWRFRRRSDGQLVRYFDPFDLAAYEAERWAQRVREQEEADMWARYADAYYAKGCPKFQRVAGGFVDLLTGELIPTPWRVSVEQGVVTARRIVETLQ